MTQEKQAEAAVEVAQAEVKQPTLEELQEQIKTLESQRATLVSSVDDAKREAKSHQEYGRRTKEELDKQRGLDSKVTRLEQRLEVATDMIADLLDKGDEIEEVSPKRKSDVYRSRLAERDRETKETQEQNLRRLASQADGLLKSVGLEMFDPITGENPETAIAFARFLGGNPEAGLEEVRKIVTDKQVKPPEPKQEVKAEPPKESDDARVARLVKEQLIKDYPDLYKSDNNSPGGSITSSTEAMARYGRGEITAEEAKKQGVNFD